MKNRASWASSRLEYRFSELRLLDQALTHRSASRLNYERLEFLGDAFLNFTIARMLYADYPGYSEGELSRARATLVNKAALADIGRGIGIDEYVELGEGERRSGGARRSAVLADSLEAVIGAVLLDGGDAAAQGLVQRLFRQALDELPHPHELKDAKTRLQEWLQGRGQSLPVYEVESMTGKEHERLFRVVCRSGEGDHTAIGEGRSRRAAEQAAARRMLLDLAGG